MTSARNESSAGRGSVDVLVITYINQCGEVCAWENAIRLKWLLNSATTRQTNEDELTERATREKFKTL